MSPNKSNRKGELVTLSLLPKELAYEFQKSKRKGVEIDFIQSTKRIFRGEEDQCF